jgi:hypothetical protein
MVVPAFEVSADEDAVSSALLDEDPSSAELAAAVLLDAAAELLDAAALLDDVLDPHPASDAAISPHIDNAIRRFFFFSPSIFKHDF